MKMMFVTSDAIFHKAGDIAGVTNNLDCTMVTGEDYPSTDNVKDVLIKNGIVPVFAITPESINIYKNLVNEWGMGETVELASDSSNIRTAIRNAFNKVSLTVQADLAVNAAAVSVGASPVTGTLDLKRCPNTRLGLTCGALKDKDVVDYQLKLSVPANFQPANKVRVCVPISYIYITSNRRTRCGVCSYPLCPGRLNSWADMGD
jgi:hypothetical protein